VSQTNDLTVVAVGDHPTLLWGMTNGERIRRIAKAAKLGFGEGETGARLLVDTAFAFDPPLLRYMASKPDHALVRDDRIVMAHVTDAGRAAEVGSVIHRGEAWTDALGLEAIAHQDGFTLYNEQLRKREQPFLIPLDQANVGKIERASYYAAYKGVTDVLTKYLWPEWALVLTRLCARAGISPNMVTAVGAVFCLLAMWLFGNGHYWTGMAAGLVFMVLDTVDGKLARCTITSSKWGNVFDHGIDLVHPPFWWWAWAMGLSAWNLAYSSRTFAIVLGVIVGGYILQRAIEGAFMRRFGQMHIHVWEKFDSDFRLITARRNPNMVILFVGTLLGRPDLALIGVAWWTAISLLVHAVRLLQAELRHSRGIPITSWLR
jgi:phosphatidylglycerophosphate synthase